MRGKTISGNMIAAAMVEGVLIHIDMIGTLGMITMDQSTMSTADMRGMHLALAVIQGAVIILTVEE